MSIRALVIDNETEIKESVIDLVKVFCPAVSEIGSATDVASGIEQIKKFKPDMVFLDVELGDGTGMDLLSHFEEIAFDVIFITAHNKYAVDAFKLSAIDFLLKPINPEELVRAVQRVIEKKEQNIIFSQLKTLNENYKSTISAEKKIVLKDLDSIFFVKTKEIIRCQADGAYTTFHLLNKEKIIISKTIKEYDELLTPCGFLRTHQSHLVNSLYIKRFDKNDGGVLVLEDNCSVPVSQRKKDYILDYLKNM
jgi:two-component system LytT family response regulator